MNIRVFTPILIFVCVSLFIRPEAFAKCRYASYTISGIVIDESTKQIISNATLFFFFDESDTAVSGVSDTDGSFMATTMFATDSGWLFFDRCNRKPKNLMVVITAPGYLAKRVIFRRKDLNAIGETLDRSIKLPAILLNQSEGRNTTQQRHAPDRQ